MNNIITESKKRLSLALRTFARNRDSRLARYLDRGAVDFHRNFENWNYRFSSKGEARVIECLC